MKTYGSAVLTALQAQHNSIDEVGEKVCMGRYRANLKDGNDFGWLKCFWNTIAIIMSNENKMAEAERR